jgi:hypothetical protein
MDPQVDQHRDVCPQGGRDKSVAHRVLHDACVKLGGEHALAHYLAVDPQTVHAWLEGHETPSDISFIKCLDLLGTV